MESIISNFVVRRARGMVARTYDDGDQCSFCERLPTGSESVKGG